MPDKDVTDDGALTSNTTPATTDRLLLVDDGTTALQDITLANVLKVVNELTADGTPDTAADYLLAYDTNAGEPKKVLMNLVGGVNGTTLSVSVTSNNLTVALKDQDGNNPSASSPVRVQIGNTVRTVTSALSVTKNAGTNWCNAGSSELATKEIDYFVYLGYNATDGVVIGFSRIPYGRRYDSFSATTTNEKYCAISTITNAAAGDAYTVIGRFAATLSAGAGYTWTVPTFTNENLIHEPIYETSWLTFTPVHTGYSSAPTGVYTYKISVRDVWLAIRENVDGTSNAATCQINLPFTALTLTNMIWSGTATVKDNGTVKNTPGLMSVSSATTVVSFGYNYDAASGFTASGAKRIVQHGSFFYRI